MILKRFLPLNREECCATLGWDPKLFHVLFASNTGDPVKRPELAKAAVDLLLQSGVPTQLNILQSIPYEDVPVWINASDVLLLTSLHEGSPTIIKEALACNRPIVSTDVGDVGARIADIKGCYLASDNPLDLMKKLWLVQKEEEKIRGRVNVEELSIEKIALKIQNFYEVVLRSCNDSQKFNS